VDERGHAQEIVPGFGWEQMLGVREYSVTPKSDTTIQWGDRKMAGAILEERFSFAGDRTAKRLAQYDDGLSAVVEHRYGAGRTIIAGTFLGLANETPEALSRSNIMVGNQPSAVMWAPHPLGAFLADWAGLTLPDLQTSSAIDFQELDADTGRLLFLINWDLRPVRVEIGIPPAKRIREITVGPGGVMSTANGTRVVVEVPAQGVRVYRVDY
jgi:hypothetical protein